jgi:hypothetical protein
MVFLPKFGFGVEASKSTISRSRSNIKDKTSLSICKLQIVQVRLSILYFMGMVLTYNTRREWQVYRNTDGITTTLRNHLKLRHSEEYERVVLCLKLKHSNEFDNPMPTVSSDSSPRGPFTIDKWIMLMIRWIVTDDQVCFVVYFPVSKANCRWCKAINGIESKEFREFILYGRDDVTERDLPHRTKLIELIFKLLRVCKHVQLSNLLFQCRREQVLCKHRLEVSHTLQAWALQDAVSHCPLYPDLLPTHRHQQCQQRQHLEVCH